jgi:hypothetical protein
MVPLLLLIVLILVFGVVGAVKLALWVLLLAVVLAAIVGFLGRASLGRTR